MFCPPLSPSIYLSFSFLSFNRSTSLRRGGYPEASAKIKEIQKVSSITASPERTRSRRQSGVVQLHHRRCDRRTPAASCSTLEQVRQGIGVRAGASPEVDVACVAPIHRTGLNNFRRRSLHEVDVFFQREEKSKR